MSDILNQPPPVPNDKPAVWDLVLADMRERDRVGRERYGTPLQPHNGRDMLADAYCEVLDMAVYLRGALYERLAMERVLACLLDHYLNCYDGNMDALCKEAEALVPAWRDRMKEWQPRPVSTPEGVTE